MSEPLRKEGSDALHQEEISGAYLISLVEGEQPASPDLEAYARRIDFTWAAFVVGTLALLFLVLSWMSGVAVPVLLAMAFAYALNPLVTAMERRGLNRVLATAITFVGMALLVSGALLYLIPVMRAEGQKLPELFKRASSELMPDLQRLLGVSIPELIRERASEFSQQASDLLQSTGPALARAAAGFAGDTARVVATVLGLLLVPVLGFFFLQDYPRIITRMESLIPRRAAPQVVRRFAEVDSVLSAFVRGQLTVGAILTALYSVGLSGARLDLAIAIGAIAGFGTWVPYVGPAIGLGLALVSVVVSWQGGWQLAVVALTFVGVQLADGLFITPRVVGKRVGLPPVVVILAVLAFGQIFGFVGALLAVPSSAVLKVVLRVVIKRYRRTQLYLGQSQTP